MAHLFRVVVAFAFAVSALPSVAGTYYKWRAQVNPISSQPWYVEPLPSCKQGFPPTASVQLQDPSTANCKSSSGGQLGQSLRTPQTLTCTAPYTAQFQGGGTVNGTWVCAAPVCQANATWNGSACVCNAGYSQSGSSCIDEISAYCQSVAGSPLVDVGFRTSIPSTGPQTVCGSTYDVNASRGCADQIDVTFCGGGSDGFYTCYGSGVRGSGTCDLSSTPQTASTTVGATPTAWPEAPPPGMCPGEVNGVAVTVPCGTSTSVSSVSSSSTTTSGTSTVSVSSQTTSTQTTCAGGYCTVTVSVNSGGSSGTSTVVSTTTGTRDSICAGSTDPACGDGSSSSFGGSCAAGFTCDGDAIQCSIAREQHVRNCAMFDDMSSSEAQLYLAEKNKTGSQTGDLPGNSSVAIGPSSFDTSNSIGGSGCITDVSITVMGTSVVLPISTICPYLVWLGDILLTVSFLLAARIVVRG